MSNLQVQTQPKAELMEYETLKQLNESINRVVLNTASILEGYHKLDAKNITAYLEKVREDALKTAGAPITQEKVQEMVAEINKALESSLKRLQENGGVDMDALKVELRKDLERIKADLEASATKIQAELKTSLDKANEQVQAIAGAKDAILQEVTEKLKKITSADNKSLDYDEIVGANDIEIELLHGASKNQPASTLCFVDWAEYIIINKNQGTRRYLKIKGFGRDRSVLQNKKEDGDIYFYDILANIKDPISRIIPLNGNYMLISQDNNYAYMLGLDWNILGCFEDISKGAVKVHFDSGIVTAHCTGDTTYVLLENGDLWASGRNPYTFGHGNNINSYNAFTKTAFKNIASIEYVADRILDNKNGIAVLDNEGNVLCAGGQGRYLYHGSNKGATGSIQKQSGYERVWCLADAVVAFKPSNQYAYAIGARTGSATYQYHWEYLCTKFKPIKVLADGEKTMYLLADKQLLCSTGCYYWDGEIQYGNSIDNSRYYQKSQKVQDSVVDMATCKNRWIIKKTDKTLWTWGLDAEKFGGISGLTGTTLKAFKIFDGADDFVCGKNFTAVLKGKTISVSRELIQSNGFAEIYTAPTNPKIRR